MEGSPQFTIEGVYDTTVIMMRNPDRRWWQFWVPKFIPMHPLKAFIVLPPKDTPND